MCANIRINKRACETGLMWSGCSSLNQTKWQMPMFEHFFYISAMHSKGICKTCNATMSCPLTWLTWKHRPAILIKCRLFRPVRDPALQRLPKPQDLSTRIYSDLCDNATIAYNPDSKIFRSFPQVMIKSTLIFWAVNAFRMPSVFGSSKCCSPNYACYQILDWRSQKTACCNRCILFEWHRTYGES